MERALTLWETGENALKSEAHATTTRKKGNVKSFVGDPWGHHTTSYVAATKKISDAKWRKIWGLSAAYIPSTLSTAVVAEDIAMQSAGNHDSRAAIVISDDES
jgi:hypothetical protein